jgi:peptidoglycan/LPS O-acetylase OafA/YrhL
MSLDAIRKNNFNLLRFVFASLVIVSHATELQDGDRRREVLFSIFGSLSFAEFSVNAFFIISGYLILKSWVDKPDARVYLSSRILRIYPGYVAAVVICSALVAPYFSAPDFWRHFPWSAFFRSVLTLHQPELPEVFPGTPWNYINGSMWTISFEFKCYLLVLAAGLAGLTKFPRTWLAGALLAGFVHVLQKMGLIELRLYAPYPRFLMFFLSGASFFLWREKLIWSGLAAIVTAVGFAVFLCVPDLAEFAMAGLFSYSLIYVALHVGRLNAFNHLPDVSYGIYLYAWPINKVLYWQYPGMNAYLAMPLVLMLAVAAGAASWYVVEKPALKLKSWFTFT